MTACRGRNSLHLHERFLGAGRLRARATVLVAVAWLAGAATVGAQTSFGGEQTIESSLDNVSRVAAAQLDGSDKVDVLYAFGDTNKVALANADGSWSPSTLASGGSSRDVAIGDLDGDGDEDLIIGEFGNSRVVWRSNDLNGTGVFLAPVSLGGLGRAQGVFVVDLDGDLDLDVVAAGRTADAYVWYDNTAGDASAWTMRTIQSGINAAQVVVAADFDGDGDLDIAGGSASGSGKLAWYRNQNGAATSWVGSDIESAAFSAVAAGDLDLDGDQDILTQDGNNLRWFENTQGDGSAWTSRSIATIGSARAGLQARDLDFDGDLDVVGDGSGDWWENVDKATSWTRRSYSSATDVADTAVIDVDFDGDLDLVTARSTGGVLSWWANQTCAPGDADDDSDTVRNGCDVCDGFDDTVDSDGDLTPDGCDVCPGFDDRVDVDGDGQPDACQAGAVLTIDDVALDEGDSGTTAFTFTVALDEAVAAGFSVDWATQDGEATSAGNDFAAAAGTLNFSGAAGETQTLVVDVTGDQRVEGNENFTVVLSNVSSGDVSIGDGVGLGTIANDDTATVTTSSISRAEGDGGSQDYVFVVTLSGEVEGGFTIEYLAEDQSASAADGDFLASAGTLSFDGGDGEQEMLTVEVLGDENFEADETFSILLRNASLGTVSPSGQGIGEIVNDDSALVTASQVTLSEGDVGITVFDFTVTLSGAAVPGGFSLPYATADGSAVAPDDYAAAAGSLQFNGTVGESHTVSVSVSGDLALEGDEDFALTLGPASVATVPTEDGAGLIVNDDAASLAIGDVTENESDAGTTFSFPVTLTGSVGESFTVPWQTVEGTATVADGDFSAASGAASFDGSAGEVEWVEVTVGGDTRVEVDEGFTVELGEPSIPALSVTDGEAVGTIVNDDQSSVVVSDVTETEGDAGTVAFTFQVEASHAVTGGFTVAYGTTDGTATVAAGDYQAVSGTLTFVGSAAEQQAVTVQVHGDEIVEGGESFRVDLGAPSAAGVVLGDGSGLGVILDDDTANLSINDVTQSEGDSGTSTFEFLVSLSDAVQGGLSVPFATVDGSATAASGDYVSQTGAAAFAGTPGEVQVVQVVVNGDEDVEVDETFSVVLSAPSVAQVLLEDGDALGTILDDDASFSLAVALLGDGEGRVTSDPEGIDCGLGNDTCSALGEADLVVELIAGPDALSLFDGFSGDPDCADGVITLDANKDCEATFSRLRYTVDVLVEGGGNVSSSPGGIDCGEGGTDCSEEWDAGTAVALQVQAAAGWEFVGWQGDADCGDGQLELVGDTLCVARFTDLFVDGFESGDTSAWTVADP